MDAMLLKRQGGEMNAPAWPLQTARSLAFPELTRVRLINASHDADGSFGAGTEGTIVFAYAEGEAYEVEVQRPRHGLLTIKAADLQAIEDAAV